MKHDERPSVRLYLRQFTGWEGFDTPYEFGYEMGRLDADAGLEPLTRSELLNVCHADYADGYYAAYDDATNGEHR